MYTRKSQKTKRRRIWLLPTAAILAVIALASSACGLDTTTSHNTSAFCAFVIGDGSDGHDSKVHKVVYPNQNVDYNDGSEKVRYVPCGPRNFIVNDGSVKNANGDQIGDRLTPSLVYTRDGTPITVQWSAFWTLNQDTEAMKNYWTLCQKYQCASDSPSGGEANFSTEGWNGLLGENFGTSSDNALLAAAATIDDSVWQKHDSALYEELGKQMADAFNDKVRARTGYNLDLFCGSGNSGWGDEDKHENFSCTNVRFVIDKVDVADPALVEAVTKAIQAQQDQAVNAQRLTAAQAIYGDQAAYWLGLQDTLEKCKAQSTSCILNLGGGNTSPVVGVPVPSGG